MNDFPVPQFVEENFEVIKAVPQECVSERRGEQTIDVLVPPERPDAGDVKTSVPSRNPRILPEYAEEPAFRPRSLPRQSAGGPQASSAEEPRLQDSGLRERSDAGDDATSMPPRMLRLPRCLCLSPCRQKFSLKQIPLLRWEEGQTLRICPSASQTNNSFRLKEIVILKQIHADKNWHVFCFQSVNADPSHRSQQPDS